MPAPIRSTPVPLFLTELDLLDLSPRDVVYRSLFFIKKVSILN